MTLCYIKTLATGNPPDYSNISVVRFQFCPCKLWNFGSLNSCPVSGILRERCEMDTFNEAVLGNSPFSPSPYTHTHTHILFGASPHNCWWWQDLRTTKVPTLPLSDALPSALSLSPHSQAHVEDLYTNVPPSERNYPWAALSRRLSRCSHS